MKKQLQYFANDGFGWHCLKCSAKVQRDDQTSRLMAEGEAESKEPHLSGTALAKWANSDKSALHCKSCGVTENTSD